MKKIPFIGILIFLCGLCFAETAMIKVMGHGKESSTIVPISIEWNDSWFEPFATPKYNHKLARAAGALCALSYDAKKKTPENILSEAYVKFGFPYNNIEWHYDIDYSDEIYGIDQAAFSIARKKLPTGRDLVIVLIRGTPGNEEEWLSNINVWDTFLKDKKAAEKMYHEGFLGAVTKIMKTLDAYATKYNIDLKKASLLITGHSRGAASSNLLSAVLADNDLISLDRTFTYTFATPNVTVREDAHDEKYNFIFNIVNGEDIVPTVPPYEKKWRFTKFGITKALVNSWNCDDPQVYQNEFIPKMNNLYSKLMSRDYHPFNTGTFIPSKIGDSLAIINSNTKKFYKGFFPLHKKLSKTIIKEFPSAIEREEDRILHGHTRKHDDSVVGIRKFFESFKRKADTKTKVLINYSLKAFIDMHAMQSYLSWLMALDEIDAFSERPSSIVRIKGVFNGAVVDNEGKIYARIYDGVLDLKETKTPLAAWQIPIGNFGPISLGFPQSQNFSLLIYRDSLVPTPIRITIERYDSTGNFLGVISKKCAGAHIGSVYSFDVGKEALEKVDGATASYKKLKGQEAKLAIKDGKLKNTDVSHMHFETHIDTDGYLEVGMTSGLQKLYLLTHFGFSTKDPDLTQSFSLGFGTQHCFCGPVMLNAEAYLRFARYTEYYYIDDEEDIYADKWLFAMVPATRLMLSIKPAKRIQFYTAFELNYNISVLNEEYFYANKQRFNITPWVINNSFSIYPTIQFGIKL